MVTNDLSVVVSSAGCQVYAESECSVCGEAVITASEIDGIYKLNQVPVAKHNALAAIQDGCSKQLWHRRLAHLNGHGMCLLRNGMQTGVDFKDEKVEPCVPCIWGKQHRLPFQHIRWEESYAKAGCGAL
jgi:hypothetical protein